MARDWGNPSGQEVGKKTRTSKKHKRGSAKGRGTLQSFTGSSDRAGSGEAAVHAFSDHVRVRRVDAAESRKKKDRPRKEGHSAPGRIGLEWPRKLVISVAHKDSLKLEIHPQTRAKDILKTVVSKLGLSRRKKLLSFGPHLLDAEDLVANVLDESRGSKWKTLHVTDFHDLGPMNIHEAPCRIPATENRGIKVRQLESLMQFVHMNCPCWYETATFKDDYGDRLRFNEVNLYQVNTWVIKPSTKSWGPNGCSYVELAAEGPDDQRPDWFVSHFWGEPVTLFAECLRGHIATRALDPETAFWVCAYANNQHELEGDITADPRNTSFFRAMGLAKGVLLILDSKGTPFTRIWCCYEMSVALAPSETSCPDRDTMILDICTANLGEPAKILTDGLTKPEMSMLPLVGGIHRGIREGHFPPNALQAGLRVDIRHADASVDADKVHILNAIAGYISPSEIDETPPEKHPNFTRVNHALSAIFILAGWAGAVERGTSLKTLQTVGKMLKRCEDRKTVDLSFAGCTHLDDEKLLVLAVSLPVSLLSLRLDMQYTQLQTMGGFGEALANGKNGCYNLMVLQLRMAGCMNLTSLDSIGNGLLGLQKLNKLELWLPGCKRLKSVKVFADGLQTLQRLSSLTLVFCFCQSLDFGATLALHRSINKLGNLHDLWLDFTGCAGIPQAVRRKFLSRFALNCLFFAMKCSRSSWAVRGVPMETFTVSVVDAMDDSSAGAWGTPIEPDLPARNATFSDSSDGQPSSERTPLKYDSSTKTSKAFFPCNVSSCRERTNCAHGYCEIHKKSRYTVFMWGALKTFSFRSLLLASALSMGILETGNWIAVITAFVIATPISLHNWFKNTVDNQWGLILAFSGAVFVLLLGAGMHYSATVLEGVRSMPTRYNRVAELMAHNAVLQLHSSSGSHSANVDAKMDRLGPRSMTRRGADELLVPPTTDEDIFKAYYAVRKLEEAFLEKVARRLHKAAAKVSDTLAAGTDTTPTISAGPISVGRLREERQLGDTVRLPSVYRVHVFCCDFSSLCTVWRELLRLQDAGTVSILRVDNGFRGQSQQFGYRCIIGTVKFGDLIVSVCLHLNKLATIKEQTELAFAVGRLMLAFGCPFFWALEMPDVDITGLHIKKRTRAVVWALRVLSLVAACLAVIVFSAGSWSMAIPYSCLAVALGRDLYARSWNDRIAVHHNHADIFYRAFLGLDGTFHVSKVIVLQSFWVLIQAGVLLPWEPKKEAFSIIRERFVPALALFSVVILICYMWRQPRGQLERCQVLTLLTVVHVVMWFFIFVVAMMQEWSVVHEAVKVALTSEPIALLPLAHGLTVSRALEEVSSLKQDAVKMDKPELSQKWALRGIATTVYGATFIFLVLACGNIGNTWVSFQQAVGAPVRAEDHPFLFST